MAGVFVNNIEERTEFLKKHPEVNQNEVFVRSGYTGDSMPDWMKYELQRHGWKRTDLVKILEDQGTPMKYATIITYMRNETTPRMDNLNALSQAFGYEMSEALYNKLWQKWIDGTRVERNGQKSIRLVPAWIAPNTDADSEIVVREINRRITRLRVNHQEIVPGSIVDTFSSYVNWLIQKDLAAAPETTFAREKDFVETVPAGEIDGLRKQIEQMQAQLDALTKDEKRKN